MCGIFGFTGNENPALLRRMADSIRHRGPDGEGFFNHDQFSMGMRRLSIIDLEGGAQPIYNEDRSLALCFNGEIYNYVELMRELQSLGHVFRTHCDTEVIVHAYEEYGEACLDKLNGMFAFALYDIRKAELFMARDRAGQKPLYYYHRGGRFIFGSEIKAILEHESVERACNAAAIDSYLTLRYVPQPETLFEGIHVLPAGHKLRLKLRSNELQIERYWDLQMHQGGGYQREEEYHEEFESLFMDAVRLTMRSDVPVGAYLSGGIDSSIVVAAMTQFTDKLNTFSIGFNSPVDETHQARALASRLGTTHHEVNITPDDFDELPKVLWHLERPIGDVLVLAYYKIAQEAARHVKVVLGGDGADESYAGYSFHKIICWTETYRKLMPRMLNRQAVAPVLDAIPVWLLDKFFIYPAYLGKSGKAKTVDFLRQYYDRNLHENYITLKALWDLDERRSIYSKGFSQLATSSWIRPPRQTSGPFLDRLLALQYEDWLQDNVLHRQEKSNMAHSLELRSPFLDHRLIEQAFRMPPNLKVRGLKDKFIERQLGHKLLPAENAKRSKNPFYFPLENFHENPKVRELLALTLDPARIARRGYFDPAKVRVLTDKMASGEFIYLKQVLSLVMLELWHMIFIDRELP
jgi:asparagine synthase (glutamine-hydrolysing)